MNPALTELLLAFLGLALAVALIIRAWAWGVSGMLWVALSWLAGFLVFGLVFRQGSEQFLESTQVHVRFMPAIVISLLAGGVAFILVRLASRAFLDWASEPEHALAGWFYGFRGGLLGILPAAIALLLAVLVVRDTATIHELRQTDNLCNHLIGQAEGNGSGKYPDVPALVPLRNAMESVPSLIRVYDVTDPLGTRAERNLAALLIASENFNARTILSERTRIAQYWRSPSFQSLKSSPGLKFMENQEKRGWIYLRLLHRVELRQALDDPEFRQMLESVDVAAEIRRAITGSNA